MATRVSQPGLPDRRRLEALLQMVLPEAAPKSLQRLARGAAVSSFVRGDRPTRDEDARRLGLVLAGYIGSWRSDADGREQLVALTGPGELAGLVGLLPEAAPAELRALSAGSVASWPAAALMDAARDDGGLAVSLLERTLEAANRLLTRLEHVSFDPVPRRLARLLWQRREILFDARRPLLSRVQLANLVGATREMTDRVLRDFEERGIVERVGLGGLVLLDEEALRELAELDADGRPCS